MDVKIPKFVLPFSMLIIPTLEMLSGDLAKGAAMAVSSYYNNYSSTLLKHFGGETELPIVNGELTAASKSKLPLLEHEMGMLQYRTRIRTIMGPWQSILNGQPIIPEVENEIGDCIQNVVEYFEEHIFKLQTVANQNMRLANNLLCTQVCTSKSKVLNLTKFKVPDEIEELLSRGTNLVPLDELHCKNIEELIEKNLITEAISFFRTENQFYPLVNETAGLKTVLEQLISQVPSNSKQVGFFTTMYEEYAGHRNDFYDSLPEGHFIDNPSVQNLLPVGTILTLSDKGLGPCLLPIEWYIEQYEVQSRKGNHVLANMSSEQCIIFLKRAIENFWSSISPEEKAFFRDYFRKGNPNCRVGVMKLVPKIHKLSTFGSNSWKVLPSRPIRGAENCPINPYSRALCKMLQEMHSALKVEMSSKGIPFPVIYGCDEYSDQIQKVNFDRLTWSQTTLITADFSDAYTKASLNDLQDSIAALGEVVNWPASKISLAKSIAKLVFENCFFETPTGIMRQTQGFPMGGHSSREGLDNILLARELELLNKGIRNHFLYYYRLVDDISLGFIGDFSKVRSLLAEMATVYPKTMPLNIQISFGYSHFLDCHMYNFLQDTSKIGFTTSLAYKPLAKFDYVPFNSNIAPQYKGRQILNSFILLFSFRLCCSNISP